MKTRDMAYISISAALIALCAWLSVPAAIPFTMQTFAVFAAAGTLGARRGAAALGLYILLGALGLPVFSGFQGGVGALLGATGGYIVGFLPAAAIAGLGAGPRSSSPCAPGSWSATPWARPGTSPSTPTRAR